MSAGIYMCNGVYAYTLNLEKKLKRRKDAVIIEECPNITSEADLQKILDTYTKTSSIDNIDTIQIYKWRNKTTHHTIESIYPNYVTDLENWEQI
jgi:hypothetical protein